ncbi:MAG: hypothetical protein JW776_04455 [Candidatus Lokiarchaeota archaeon]|nr:hypothetical protein [Candidatus Lokiarchaeota archaeon]
MTDLISELSQYSVPNLKKMIKSKSIGGYSKLKSNGLIQLLIDNVPRSELQTLMNNYPKKSTGRKISGASSKSSSTKLKIQALEDQIKHLFFQITTNVII